VQIGGGPNSTLQPITAKTQLRLNADVMPRTGKQVVINDPWLDAIKRFVRHLPEGEAADSTLVVLKGHLLIEALLRQVIDQNLVKPKALEPAQLEFHQILCIAEAMYAEAMPKWLWLALRKLNSIRNYLAHRLEHTGISEKLRDFTKFVEDHRDKRPGLRSLQKGTPLKLALSDVHTQLLMLVPYDKTEA
jgi:hypothetical protein